MAIIPTSVLAPPSDGIGALANAIAQAENVDSSANNPGALALGDQGNGVLNSAGITIFSSPAAGAQALYNQLDLVLNGQSSYENVSMTIAQFAMAWTGNDNPSSWAATVAGALGTSTSTTIGQILEGAPATSPAVDTTVVDASGAAVPVSTAGVSTSGWSISTIALLVAAGFGLLLFWPSGD